MYTHACRHARSHPIAPTQHRTGCAPAHASHAHIHPARQPSRHSASRAAGTPGGLRWQVEPLQRQVGGAAWSRWRVPAVSVGRLQWVRLVVEGEVGSGGGANSRSMWRVRAPKAKVRMRWRREGGRRRKRGLWAVAGVVAGGCGCGGGVRGRARGVGRGGGEVEEEEGLLVVGFLRNQEEIWRGMVGAWRWCWWRFGLFK